jgi:ADP-ribose pyrophosphatase YjhB (NUDIX family)
MEVKVVVNVVLTHQGRLLLVRYQNMPDQQMGLMLPSAIVSEGGQVQETPNEIIHGQLGMGPMLTRIRDADSFIGRDDTWHVSLTFLGEVAAEEAKPAAFVAETHWVAPSDLGGLQLAHSGWTRSIISRVLSP